jgi:hypothetical protein
MITVLPGSQMFLFSYDGAEGRNLQRCRMEESAESVIRQSPADVFVFI